jgi:hypothetical protein
MILDLFNNSINLNSLCILCLIIICGIGFIYLNNRPRKIEHFPSTLRYTEKIRQKPKLLLPKITSEMHKNSIDYGYLPDDYEYLYNYEKNFSVNRVYGDYTSRLDGYKGFLIKNKNSFHNLDEKDLDNLTKLLNNIQLTNEDIPKDFIYNKDFGAMNK